MSEDGISDTTLSCAATALALANKSKVEPTVTVSIVNVFAGVWTIDSRKVNGYECDC
jgi:hypothetical protein